MWVIISKLIVCHSGLVIEIVGQSCRQRGKKENGAILSIEAGGCNM